MTHSYDIKFKKYWCEQCHHEHYTEEVMMWLGEIVPHYEHNGKVYTNEARAFFYYSGMLSVDDIPKELLIDDTNS